MLIGIDASRYKHDQATGVEWYSKHIIDSLIKDVLKNDEDKIILYSREPLVLSKNERVKNKVLKAKKFWTLKRLSKEMKQNPPDVLFVPSHTLPLTTPKHSVIMIHDVAFRYLRKAYTWRQYHYLNWSTKFAVKNASRIIVPSEATAHDLKYFFKCPEDKIVVIQHGFSPPDVHQKEIDSVFKNSDAFKYFGINKTTPYILFVGRLESKKNLVHLVQAFAKFSEMHPDYKLILAGKRGVGFDDILKVVNKLEILDKVIMPGYITEEEKAALYKYCKLFTFPSFYEGFGLPILEAFHYKKPVLTSKVSSLPEVAGDGACYCDPYDPEMIEICIDKLINNESYANELVEKGTKKLKSFSWKKAAKQTLNILHGQ